MKLTTERQLFEGWFTKKYPRSYWGVEKTASGEYQGGLTAQLWEAWKESRGGMANREAQPVAATPIYQIWDDDGWCDTSEQIWRETYDDFRKEQYRIVYTAPPGVPEAITAANAPEVFEIAAAVERLGLRGAYGAYAVGWNSCIAVMLAAAPAPNKR